MLRCVIWYKPLDNTYYHKIIKCHYEYFDYKVGNYNSYGHQIVHIIDNFDFKVKKFPIKKRIVYKTIKFLQKYE